MRNNQHLWGERALHFWQVAIGYFRLIGNSGFLFAVYVTVILGSYFYAQGIDQLPEDFPALMILTILFTIITFIGQIRTFVKEADIVFLLPAEKMLSSYFKKSIIYSLLFHSFYLLVTMIVLLPIFLAFVSNSLASYIFIGIGLLIVKYWNILLTWHENRLVVKEYYLLAKLARFVISLMVVYGILQADLLGISLGYFILILYYFYSIYFINRRHTLKWDRLISIENKMLRRLYRLANLFTDVPELQDKVKSRKILSIIVRIIPYKRKNAYLSLFIRSFLRSNDHLGSYIRLVVIGNLLLFIVPEGILRFIVLILFLYMTSVQLFTLWQSKRHHMLFEMYPVPDDQKLQSFQILVGALIIIETIIFAVIARISGATGYTVLIFLALGVIFTTIFTNWNIKRYIRKKI